MNVTERFLHYVSFETTSDEDGTTSPTTQGQRVFGEALTKELTAIGMADAHIDENGYVYAFLPASAGCETMPAIGLIAHMDTSPDVSGKNVCASIVRYTGEDLTLANGEVLSATRFPSLGDYIGKDLVKSVISGVLAEVVMVGGYFCFEATILGNGLGAAVGIASNLMQALAGIVCAVLIKLILDKKNLWKW